MRKFLTNLLAVVASAGLKDKFDRKELTKEDQAALIEAYNKAHGAGHSLMTLQIIRLSRAPSRRRSRGHWPSLPASLA
jgi:hypothetical protein